MSETKALAWLHSLAPLARVDRIEIWPHENGTVRYWLATSSLWGRQVNETPTGVLSIETPRFELVLPELARAVHQANQDTVQRLPHEDAALNAAVWERTMERTPGLEPLPVMHLGPDTDPVWDPATASQDQADIAGFNSGLLIQRHRHGTLDKPERLWVASDGIADSGSSPGHAILALIRLKAGATHQ